MNRWTAIAAAAGLPPKRQVTLEVRGRRTGRLLSFPVVVADYEDERHLVAMLGRPSRLKYDSQRAPLIAKSGKDDPLRPAEDLDT